MPLALGFRQQVLMRLNVQVKVMRLIAAKILW
ncbi:MAG: hypothetical protein ACI8VC_001846 [Candidatus Endobugula sp.]|jgi:hypothetical protein